MEGVFEQRSRYQRLLEEFRQVMHTDEVKLVETYLLFLQVAGESFDDRQAFLGRFALSEGKVGVIMLLKESGQSTPSELAEELGVTPGTITGLLAGLERAGLIRREEHPIDRRKATITLTPGTQAFFDQVLAERFHHIKEIFSAFTSQEQEQLRALLVKLHQRFLDGSSS